MIRIFPVESTSGNEQDIGDIQQIMGKLLVIGDVKFLHVQLCAQLRVCSQAGGIPVYPRFSQPDNSESWDDAGNGIWQA